MTPKRSPGGSIFPYNYKGAEIFGLHLGSFRSNEEGLLARMKAEEEFIANTNRQFPLWIDFYESKLTDRILIDFVQGILRNRTHITKLAVVGCTFRDKRRILRIAQKTGCEFAMPVRFFSDPEVAKTWLVSEAG